jgi:hypothetical protein
MSQETTYDVYQRREKRTTTNFEGLKAKKTRTAFCLYIFKRELVTGIMDDLDDEQRALIPHSLRELTLHCIYKGLQIGPTVTIATALPYQLYKSRKNPSLIPILSRVGTATIYGGLAGVVLSVAMMHAKLYKEQYNEYKIWDRAYRIRNSASQ